MSRGSPRTIAQALRATAAAHPRLPALGTLGDERVMSWSEVRERADAIARGLHELGAGRGDTIALMLSNRPELQLADLAALTLGAVPFSIYGTLPPEQIRHLVENSGARIAIVERESLERIEPVAAELDQLAQVVVVGGGAGAGAIGFERLAATPSRIDLDLAAAAVEPDDLATLIYTSGTTGPPKGVELTHAQILAQAASGHEVLALQAGDRVISWLPAAHIAERMANYYIPVIYGLTVTCCPDPSQIATALAQVRPQWFFAVPRVWEKLKAGVEASIAALDDEQRAAVQAAIEAATRRIRLVQRGEPVPGELDAAVAAADARIFSSLRERLGLDSARALAAGAAATPPGVLEFFNAIGIAVGELWGMSETCGAGTMNPPGAVRIGTVGTAMPGFEVRTAPDGELEIRGPSLMRGYRGQPRKTAEAIDADGWLATGDLAEIDDDGYVRIVDRKKEIIVNAAGKNMSPVNIEAAVKGASPLIGQACVIGNDRPYIVALIVLDPDVAGGWARSHGLDGDASPALLAREDTVREHIRAAIAAANERLARVEQVKRFEIVAGDWLPGGDELTPTMKLKRAAIAAKYAQRIDALYAPPRAAA